jgi:phospholipid/cholesterol/gamma-HCH transport system ATP-binding protein
MVVIEHVHKRIGGKTILDDVNLTVHDNEVFTLMGKSGTGKTVLLKTIIGLMSADSGRVVLDGEDITDFTEQEYNALVRNRMTMVFQHGALWDSMTVGQNIDLALNIRQGLSETQRTRLIKESLELVGLEDTEFLYPEELSGGMVKRAAIARAIAARPKYILYDEPTTGLDPVLSNMVIDLILKLDRELEVTSLIISHDIHNAQRISDRVGLLYNGSIVHTCNAEDMWNQTNDLFNHFLQGDGRLL